MLFLRLLLIFFFFFIFSLHHRLIFPLLLQPLVVVTFILLYTCLYIHFVLELITAHSDHFFSKMKTTEKRFLFSSRFHFNFYALVFMKCWRGIFICCFVAEFFKFQRLKNSTWSYYVFIRTVLFCFIIIRLHMGKERTENEIQNAKFQLIKFSFEKDFQNVTIFWGFWARAQFCGQRGQKKTTTTTTYTHSKRNTQQTNGKMKMAKKKLQKTL